MKIPTNYHSLFFSLCLCLLLNGCTLVYKGTGNILISYAEDQGIPYLLKTDDVSFSCSMVESFAPFLLSFSRVTSPPDHLAILFYLMAGTCTEFKAWDEELRYLRAIYNKNPIEAQDARIAQQRYLSQAAQRQLTGYNYLSLAFSEPGAECPLLDTDIDQLYWLMGLISGLQAVLNDIASAGNVQVPLDIAAKIGRAAVCLNNDKWWGIPQAIQATIWITIPGNKPVGKDPIKILDNALQTGLQQGIKISHVLAAQVHFGLGDMAKVKQIIRSLSKARQATADSQIYELLNQVANRQIQQISDRLWTEATGTRTPIGKLGYFWDDPAQAIDTIDIDGFL